MANNKYVSLAENINNQFKEEVRVLKFNNKFEYDLYLILNKYPRLYNIIINMSTMWPLIKELFEILLLRNRYNKTLNYS